MAVSRRHDKYYRPANNSGFTIIEVVLVLAIAGLIFIVVFLALPALQKSQRDNARKQDVARTIAGMQQYMVDHNKQWPSTGFQPNDTYFSGLAQATYSGGGSGTTGVRIALNCDWGGGLDYIDVLPGCKCDTPTGTGSTTAAYAAVAIKLEANVRYCRDM